MTNVTLFRRLLGGSLVVFALLASATWLQAGGDFFRVSRVEAYSTDTWTVWVPAGDNRVVVDGDGDTDLDCYVHNESGRLVGVDDDSTDYCVVDFYAPTSGRVTIRIRNLGGVFNRYTLSVR